MSKEIIKNVISVYIQEEKSDYAVMLNGAWGSGKTYFVKNELIDYLQEEFNRKILYISLFGISNIDELYNNIALQVLNIKATETLDQKIKMNNPSYNNSNKKTIFERSKISLWTGILNKGLKILPDNNVINSVVSEVNKNIISFNKYVFIFDDVERSTLDFDVLLGFFDQIVDQNGAKAILICNENEIDAINEKYYKKFKEKVIGLTIDYKSDINKDFYSLAKIYFNNEECKKYVIEAKKDILNLFNVAETSNLRTLIFIFKRFEEIYNKLSEIYLECDKEKLYFDKFMREILLSVVGSSILIKEKHQNNDFKDEQRIISFIKEPDKKKFSSTGPYQAYKFIDDYLSTYNFKECKVKGVITEFIKNEEVNPSNIISKLDTIFDVDNDEIAINKLRDVLDEIKSDKLNINVYPKILDKVFILIKILFTDSVQNNEIEHIKIKIRENAENRIQEFSSFSWSTFPYNDEDAKIFRDELFEVLNREKIKVSCLEWKSIFESDKNFVEKFTGYLKQNYGMFGKDNKTMSYIGADKVLQRIENLKIKELNDFWISLTYVFNEEINNLKDFYSVDKEFFKELKEKIENNLLNSNEKSAMQKFQLKNFCNYLQRIYDKL